MLRCAFAAAARALRRTGFGLLPAARGGAALALLLLIALPGESRAYTSCSPYMGQVVVNEVRIGRSNKTDVKNQFEFFNIGGAVPASVWQSSSSRWKVVVYGGNSASQASLQGTYPLDTAFTSSGNFIYSSGTTGMWARNGDNKGKPRAFDLALLDGNGSLVAYIAIGAGVQAIPACYSSYDSNATIKASTGGDTTGDLMRPIDGTGTWPTPVPTIPYNTIGRTNACNTSGANTKQQCNSWSTTLRR